MKKVYILLCALAALAAASCTDKEEQPALLSGVKVAREFSTLLTKTTLGGTSVYWEEDDAISVFDGVSNNKFDITGYDNDSPSASATFAGEVDGGANTFYAVYPYAAGNSLAGSTLTASVPASQTLRANSFTSGAALAVAYTKSNSLAFHQATAILGITLESYMTDVESIEFSGNGDEYVAGAVSIAMNTSTGAISSVTPGTGSKKVTLTGTFVAGQTYYLAFIPQTFSSGMKVIVTFDSGKTAIATSDKSLATSAGIIYPIADFTRVSLPYAAFAAKNSFNYDAGTPQNLVPESFANIASISVDDGPSGWDIAWNTDHFEVTPPTQAEIQANPQTVAPAGVFELTLRSAAGHTREVELPVRLYGINSKEEFNAFKDIYGAAADTPTTTGLDDYLVGGTITLNSNLSFSTGTSGDFQSKAYVLKYLTLPLDGNNRTITGDINTTVAVAGFLQGVKANVSNLYLDGTWMSSAKSAYVAALAARGTYNTAVTLTNVHLKSTATVGATGTATCVGGLVAIYSACTNKLTFDHCSVDGTVSAGTVTYIAGFIASSKDIPVDFVDSDFNGALSASAASQGRVAGFITNGGKQDVSFTRCNFTEGASISATGTFYNAAAFIANSGTGTATTCTMSYCNLKGTITFTLTSSEYNRRIGGFVGDASRVVSLDHCENSGTMVLYDKGYGVNGFGGLIGRTTKQTDGYTMSFTVTNSTFSGSMTVYAPTSDRATSLSETTNNFGTLIGCNAATTGGVTIDGESYTSGSSLNYSGTSVSFLVEP